MRGVIRARAVPEGATLQVQGVWGHRRQSLSCREREDCESRPGRQGFLTGNCKFLIIPVNVQAGVEDE